ncbi:MFS transporter [Cereibacter azotoformans]|uniref:GPH family glycoside/pentoside/hexuronide:cation symporter n=1 Tax=Cereibacter azotoformans TaxID=43057 RepID=A0A2T5K2U5_9RHOB|nr:MFS transporter [Cereibacter azotoformans]AXQ94681.1 sugar:cation symporter [Cereibacter sphaeroides]MBO4170467.1 MFS transporter [Cereibacter azotoformans]PTR16735.1 GPH family glycoside/pentoside/hexuronide:cation symporter [Cereibacter azotoformans]UIJ30245.1 MFS transporter [Cereibacter azotoformans]
MTARLLPWSLLAGLIAAAGLPIYIHAPKVYVDEYGLSLGALGAVLAALRLVDVVQDPALGWLAEVTRRRRAGMVAGAVLLLALAMVGLFAVTPPVAPLLWFALMLVVLFSAFSFLTIAFYSEGVGKAARLGPGGHLRLAGWREAGALAGVSLAAVAPVVLGSFALFAWGFAGLALVAWFAMRREWAGLAEPPRPDLRAVLRDPMIRRLLLLALVNAAPVAVTSTLFLFFVESRLDAAGWEGPLLLLFFLAAAASAPGWSRAARTRGAKPVLLAGMALAVASFVFAFTLGPGEIVGFALICAASGAALGADMVLLPAIFARHLARTGSGEATAFGLWSFASKLALALAAASVLPLLQLAGFTPGSTGPEGALLLLSVLYALVPCALKVFAILLLLATPIPES